MHTEPCQYEKSCAFDETEFVDIFSFNVLSFLILLFNVLSVLLFYGIIAKFNRFNLNSVAFYMPFVLYTRINTAACHSLARRHYFIQYDSLTYPYTKTHTLINRIIAQNSFAMLLG